jgi:hypothetical protein
MNPEHQNSPVDLAFNLPCHAILFCLLSSRLLSKHLKIKIYKTIILPVVLYGFLTLREEHRLRAFENRMLRGILGPKRKEVARGWRRLHTEELHNIYASPNIIRMTR